MKRAILVAIPVLLIAVLILLLFRTDEPLHSGRTRSEWLGTIRPQKGLTHSRLDSPRGSPAVPAETLAAIRALGTNQIPYYLARITNKPSLYQKTKRDILEELTYLNIEWEDPKERRS